MKSHLIHPNLIKSVVQSLEDVFEGGYYADKVLERRFKENKKWGARDRRFMAETVYEIVRWWGWLNAQLEILEPVSTRLRWAAFEQLKNNRDVTESLLGAYPEVARSWMILQKQLRTRKLALLKPWDEVSFPQWLFELLVADYGSAEALSLAHFLNTPAPVCLRVNTIRARGGRDWVAHALKSEGVDVEAPAPLEVERMYPGMGSELLVLIERKNVFATSVFKQGFFEVQDRASQMIGHYLSPEPGERVADCCAGAGGKTLHLAALMQNKGSLLACDVSERKLAELKIRARRAHVNNFRTELIEGTKDIKKHAGLFDRVLIDAPCSGTGVIRRNPDTKWKLTAAEIERLGQLQIEILDTYSRWVKPGGVLVYATCSVLKSENQTQVDAFLARHPEFRIDSPPLVLLPQLHGTDGFFAQRMKKLS